MSRASRGLWALFALGLALRLACAAALGTLWSPRNVPLYDDGVYLEMAESFLGRNDAVFATHPPAYPLFLSPFAALGDPGILAARWVQIVLGAMVGPLAFLLAGSLGLSRESGLSAGILAAGDPMLAFFSTRFMSETLFSLLVAAFFLAWLSAWSRGEDRLAVVAGALGGLASLTRGTMLGFGGMLALAVFLKRREQGRWLRLLFFCGAAWALTVSFWTARNWARFGRFVPISAQGGWNLYEGMTADPLEIAERPKRMGLEAQALGLKDPFELDAHFSRKAKDWIRAHPGEFAWLTARKALKFWRPFPYPPHPAAVRWAVGLFTLALFALALWGLPGLWARRGFGFVLAWAVYLTAVHSVFASNLRYRLPLEIFIAIPAGAGLLRLWARGRLR